MGDFRRERRLLSPAVFFWQNGEPETWPPHAELIDKDAWDDIMGLATHVALEASGYTGQLLTRLNTLSSDWTLSWPEPGTAPFADYPSLVAGEEFDALVFNAMHGYYRQAISCLRVALETLTMAASFGVTGDTASFELWQSGELETKFGQARARLRDSGPVLHVDEDISQSLSSIFGNADSAWLNTRYKRLCNYTHSRAEHDNGGFWESNGPLFVPQALATVERELRETLALCYLLQRLACPAYQPSRGATVLLDGPTDGWSEWVPVLRTVLL